MRFHVTVFAWLSWIVLVGASFAARAQVTITGTMLGNTTNTVGNYGSLPTDCTYRFTVSAPSVCSPTGWSWSFPNGTTGITASSSNGSYLDVKFSTSASSYQQLSVQVGGNCNGSYPSASGSIVLFVAPFNPNTATVVASANPICVNTSLTLSLQSIVGATSVDWSGNGQTYSSTNAANGFAWTLGSGISAATTFQATIRGCGYMTATKTITVTPLVEAGMQVAGERDVVTSNNQGSVTLTNYRGTIQSWQSSVDNGASWTTLNQSTEDLSYSSLTTTTLYRALTSLCGVTYTSSSCTVRVHAATDDPSWTETKVYAQDGNQVVSDSRAYVDGFGKPLQLQSKSLSTGRVLATQPLYGKYDQAVGSSLAAPIAATDFSYTPGFISPASAAASAYDYTRFDDGTKLNSPEALSSSTPNTLGWYYSTSNTTEPYTASTNYPYSRTDAVSDGSTGVSRSVGPAPGLQLGSGRETVQGSFAVRAELDTYAAIRQALLPSSAVGTQPLTLQKAAVQSVVVDADGNRALSFADKQGHTVMNAWPATSADAWLTTSNTVEVGWPYSTPLSYQGVPVTFTALSDLMLYNSQGQWVATGSADNINQALVASGQSNQTFTVFSLDGFTADNGVGTVVTAQWREAYAFYNFYLAGDGTASITNQPATPSTDYEIINSVTGNVVTPSGNSPLAPGCYQIRIKKGAISLTYTNRFKDISFNFYNQKGQLVESIAPNGVKPLLQSYAASGTASLSPTYVTTFEYDQQGRQIAMTEADAGRTSFLYRTDGRVRFSQNAKQYKTGSFSYLGYDVIGRVVESGECVNCIGSNTSISTIPSSNAYWINDTNYGGSGLPGYYPRRDIVRTTYDQALPVRDYGTMPNTDHGLSSYVATFLLGRVATVERYASGSPYGGYSGKVSQTWFSYDDQGRVQWQIQQTSGQPARTVDYTYTAAGGTATVCYQKGVPAERLTHYYTYDADNRLSIVSTDPNDPANTNAGLKLKGVEHGRYTYYLTGALKRVAYNFSRTFFTQSSLQGVDYTYTAAGQLKSINDGDLQYDPGQDGRSSYADFWGTTLNYYGGDYTATAVPNTSPTLTYCSDCATHYNGLVSSISWQGPSTTNSNLFAYGYKYDTKNQLLKATYGTVVNYSNRQYNFYPSPAVYGETISGYDPNGNLQQLQRTDGMGAATLAGAYQYTTGTNQLAQVLNANSPATSYSYNEIGQVTSQQDQSGSISSAKYLDYNSGGLVTAIYADNNRSLAVARYTYDEYGRRLTQQVYPTPTDQNTYTTTTYVRDLLGHELASYVATTTAGASTSVPVLYEQPLYGASRLGIYRRARDQSPDEFLYELNDQLGNTRVVFRAPPTKTYVLSLEDARVNQEKQDFPEPTATTYDNTRTSEHYYAASSYNASTGLHYSTKLIGQQGPTKSIIAQRGDRITISVYAAYPSSSGTIANARTTGPFLIGGINQQPNAVTSPLEGGKPTSGLSRALSRLSVGLAIPLGQGTQRVMATQGIPDASVQYVVYNAADNTYLRTGKMPIDAGGAGNWELLQLSMTVTDLNPIKVVIFTQNQDGTQPVYFDDLTIYHTLGPIVEENNFYAYGQRLDGLSWRRTDERVYGRGYQGQNTMQDAESGYTAFDLRMYDARYGRWLNIDPKRQHYSGFQGMGNNPISNIDLDGGEDNPIFDRMGNLLGTDDLGLQGPGIVMDAKNFTQGMSHSEAMSYSLGFAGLNGLSSINKFTNTMRSLPSRPDYDGYLTKSEADAWWKNGNGKPLYVNESLIDLTPVTTANFENTIGKTIFLNFGIRGPILEDTGNVYGTLDMTLLNATGAVSIGYKTPGVSPHGLVLDYYNFEPHGNGEWFRDFATWVGKPFGNGTDFDILGYGHGQVPVSNYMNKSGVHIPVH